MEEQWGAELETPADRVDIDYALHRDGPIPGVKACYLPYINAIFKHWTHK